LASSSNREAISHVKWLQDNDTLVFIGERPGETPQLYKVHTSTKKIEKLTDQATPVVAYSISDDGEAFAYISTIPAHPIISDQMRRNGFPVTSNRWEDLYLNKAPDYDSRREIFVKSKSMHAPKRLRGIFNLLNSEAELVISLSPDGRYALLQAFRLEPPKLWSEYQMPQTRISNTCLPGDAYGCPSEYLVIDMAAQTITPLLNAPVLKNWPASELFAWTSSDSVLLINALLPLDTIDTAEKERRQHYVYVAEVTLPSKKIVKAAERESPFAAFEIKSEDHKDCFLLTPLVAIDGPPIEFTKQTNGWAITEMKRGAAEPTRNILVTLAQNRNSPPKLVATDPKSKKTHVLLDLNPQFAELTFGKVEEFTWKTRGGLVGEGSLYYPPNYTKGEKYPLIIQTHGNSREHFWIDGPFPTAFAAQPLANKGFVVLQMDTGNQYHKDSLTTIRKIYGTAEEGPMATAFIESAVDELDRRGLVDRERIGITGFSRTAFHVLYFLTHSNYHIAAAVVADGVNFGYVKCLYYIARWDRSLCERINGGGPPYGTSLANWSAAAPTFNLDKIEAPLLLQTITAPLGEWEIFAGLRWLNKPVELLSFYPEGTHELVKPRQRLLSQGSVVDWYCFWLKGQEDPDPAKSAEYQRWRKLRGEKYSNSQAAN